MGNVITEPQKKTLTLQDLSTRIGDYRTIHEGDPEMAEDPDFPQTMMREALNSNTNIEGNYVQGTYVYYPNKQRPKMWIGNYKILNPEDILCKNIAEKMGMTEIEWRNYIKKKNGKQEEPNINEHIFNIDYSYDEPTQNIQYIMRNDISTYPLDENKHIMPYNGDIHNVSMDNHDIYIDKKIENVNNEYSNINEIKNNFDDNEKMIYADRIYSKNSIDKQNYIDQLNSEVLIIREEQEKIINGKRKDIYKYSSNTCSDILNVPQDNESYLTDNTIFLDPKNINDNINYNTDDSVKYNINIIEQILSEKKKKNICSQSNLKGEQNPKGYKALSSISTKGSLGLTDSSVNKSSSNNNLYINVPLIK